MDCEKGVGLVYKHKEEVLKWMTLWPGVKYTNVDEKYWTLRKNILWGNYEQKITDCKGGFISRPRQPYLGEEEDNTRNDFVAIRLG
jgi:hypothetical protein